MKIEAGQGTFKSRKKAGAVAQMRDLAQLAALLGVQIDIDEMEYAAARPGKNSIRAKIKTGAGAVANPHNWYPTIVDATHLTISPSTVGSGYPTIGGTSINASTPPQLAVHATDVRYIVLAVTFSPTVVNGIITNGTITSRVITSETSVPTDTTTVKYFHLFSHHAGVISQVTFWNIGIEMRDDGSATSTPEYRTWVAA